MLSPNTPLFAFIIRSGWNTGVVTNARGTLRHAARRDRALADERPKQKSRPNGARQR